MDDAPWRKQQPITAGVNATGQPTLCLPCGFSREGRPLSMQLLRWAFDEATVPRVGFSRERAAGWRERRPPV